MSVAEYDGKNLTVIRCNQSYKKFVGLYPEFVKVRQTVVIAEVRNNLINAILNGVMQCEREGQTVFLDETMENGDILHVLLRKVAINPLTEVSSFALAILGITPKEEKIK